MSASDALNFIWARLPPVPSPVLNGTPKVSKKTKPTKFWIVLQASKNLRSFKIVCFSSHGKVFLPGSSFTGTRSNIDMA